MKINLVVLSLLLLLPLSAQSAQTRIVNGDKATTGQFPWQVAIYYEEPGYIPSRGCGGSIIHENWILSAAHCFYNLGDIKPLVYAGKTYVPEYATGNHETSLIGVTVFSHPNYNDNTLDNDIALLKLDRPINFNRCTSCEAIPIMTEAKESLMDPGTNSIVSGFGTTTIDAKLQSDDLLYTNLTISSCETVDQYALTNSEIAAGKSVITSNMFCAMSTSSKSCEGDSGGPLIVADSDGVGYLLAGIVSFGDGCDPASGVAEVYTRVSQYEDWIREVTKKECCTPEPDSSTNNSSRSQFLNTSSGSSGGSMGLGLIILAGLLALRRKLALEH